MPDSFVQGHGAWHCLTAVATLMIWLFFDQHKMTDILKPEEEEVVGEDQEPPSKVPALELTDEGLETQGDSNTQDRDPL